MTFLQLSSWRLGAALAALILMFGDVSLAGAQTINATTCSQADVQAAISVATSGATVWIPPGTCTWSSSIAIPNSTKITIRGAGRAVTTIRRSPAGPAFGLSRSGSRVTEIHFVDASVIVDGANWRVDHNKFSSSTFSVAVHAYGVQSPQDYPVGLIDHNEFVNTRVLVFGGDLMAPLEWRAPYIPGSGDAVYIEANTFTFNVFGNVVDCNYGGRYVFRHNLVVDSIVEAHSVQSNNRACRSWEIYNNTIRQANRTMWTPFFLRGGTGVVFNNTLEGTWSLVAIAVDNRRSYQPLGDGGLCDGSSPWDGNLEVNGYPCRDQIGRSDDSFLWTQSTPYPPQKLEPMYAWNNFHGATPLRVSPRNNSDVHIREGRDYYHGHKPGYASFPYPHPKVVESPMPPRNLRIVPGGSEKN